MLNSNGFMKYFLLYFAFIIYSLVTVCAKMASMHSFFSKEFIFYIAIEICFLGLYAILWQQILKYFDLVTAISSKGIVIIINILWAVIIFKEIITMFNIIGAMIIISGIWMVNSDG